MDAGWSTKCMTKSVLEAHTQSVKRSLPHTATADTVSCVHACTAGLRLVHSKRGQNDHFALTRARAGRRRRTLAVHRRDSVQGHGHHLWPCPGHVSELRRPSSQTGEQARTPTQCYGVDGADQAARKPGAHHRYHGRVASWQGCMCCVWPFARPGCDHHH